MGIKFECPHCEKTLEAAVELAGETRHCPNCGKKITVPQQNSKLRGKGKKGPK